ncbi:hypothetical protein [Costertonia aggregata]|uniref:Uncharacterized protein n=1 Tax=Costertonia aggregata TaxID=343403 RepID=A0A7H9APQ1_9FLAO|nr:hypothetical protein [Costertonia aggregata]QLG45406.1 hypothetical protein HYG79_08615 [Costertonia aggregata]
MVKIIDFKSRENEQGKKFFALIVRGGVEPLKSKETGKLYFTSKTASVPSTFDEETCKELIGTSFEGSVKRVSCKPYEFTIEDTQEIIELDYRFEYVNEALELIEERAISSEEVY